MIIQSLEMENFRQYYGKQTIEFAASDSNQIVTVILGENGRGKTSIYRAMMLALFGDVKLAQDAKEANILLANIKAVDEQHQYGNGVYCKVTLNFRHRNEQFTIQRVYFAMKDEKGTQREELYKVKLVNHTTNEEWDSEKDIQFVIKQIIDERVKHYFFFDGERIERLTRVSNQQRQEVTAGIKNLLKIDQVLKAKEILQTLMVKATKELERHSTGDYKKALRELSVLKEKFEQLKIGLTKLEEEEHANHLRLSEIDHALQTYHSMRDKMKEREELEGELARIQQTLNGKFGQALHLNKYIPLLMGKDVFYQQLVWLENELIEHEGGIESDFIDSLLKDLRCICGTTFEQESSIYRELSALADAVKQFEANKELHAVQAEMKQLLAYLDGRTEQISQLQNEIIELQGEQDHIHYRLEDINKQLSGSGENKMKELNDERKQLITRNIKIDYEVKQNKASQEKLQKDIATQSLQVKELERISGLHQNVLTKHAVLDESNTLLASIIKTFEKELLEELELATTQNLLYLLDQSGQEIIQEAKITNDYNLEVLNNYGQPFLANISQGQRQVLSLSFITALAQVAGGTNTLEMPLFMDTPFGRLSGQHQENLIEYLPQVCSQWILLVTDKEFGEQEQKQFVHAETIGRFYTLESEEAGVTIIKEVPTQAYKERLLQYE